jgi:hypothetical protein
MFQPTRLITRLQDLREDVKIAEAQYSMAKWLADDATLAHKLKVQDDLIAAAEAAKAKAQAEHDRAKAQLPELVKGVADRRRKMAEWVNRNEIGRLADLATKSAQLAAQLAKAKAESEATTAQDAPQEPTGGTETTD